jgi:hypothetical protein
MAPMEQKKELQKQKGKLKDNEDQKVQNPNKQFLLKKGESFSKDSTGTNT